MLNSSDLESATQTILEASINPAKFDAKRISAPSEGRKPAGYVADPVRWDKFVSTLQ